MRTSRVGGRRQLPGSPFDVPEAAAPAECYAVDDQVTHDKNGLGTVIGVETGIAVLVDFGPRKLRITIPCSKLTRLWRCTRPPESAWILDSRWDVWSA
jgi:hypothetical protein